MVIVTFHRTVGVRMLKHVKMGDKEQHDIQIHKRTKDRPRAFHYSHQSKHFDHGFAYNSSHKYCKANNKQSTKHHMKKVQLYGDGTYLSGMKAMQEK